MKNIHVLSTDKPSRLHKAFEKTFILSTEHTSANDLYKSVPHNIYITSDEEIKDGDYFIRYLDGKVYKSPIDKEIFGSLNKIILTTDQDFIKDGVQAIDDEFLEWFVKNPSCDEVEVEKVECQMWSLIGCNKDDVGCCRKPFKGYKIIIPKEEPKKETLEEAAERLTYHDTLSWENTLAMESFKLGAKWQQERMYSEEEIIKILIEYDYSKINDDKLNSVGILKKWFTQFKK